MYQKNYKKFALDETGWKYNQQGTFTKKSMIRKRKLSTGKTVEEKVAVTWNEKYAKREKIRRNGAVEYAAKLTNPELFRQTAKKGGKKYLELEYIDPDTNEKKPFNPFISIDYSQVSEDEKFDGINALVTSEVEMPDEEIISNYNQLNKIENCFRVTKTDISARPVYVWLDNHIQSHFLTCFISLTILRYTKYLLNNEISEEVIINALQSARCEVLSNGYTRINASEDLIALHKKLHIDFKMKNIETEKLEKYSKNWCTTFSKTKKEA